MKLSYSRLPFREVLGPHGEHERGLGLVQVGTGLLHQESWNQKIFLKFSCSSPQVAEQDGYFQVSSEGRSRPCDLICLGEGADPGQVLHCFDCNTK